MVFKVGVLGLHFFVIDWFMRYRCYMSLGHMRKKVQSGCFGLLKFALTTMTYFLQSDCSVFA